jgi:hypothetical protein
VEIWHNLEESSRFTKVGKIFCQHNKKQGYLAGVYLQQLGNGATYTYMFKKS